MATAKATEEDQLKGYSLNIDDYIIKPFSPKILVAKVNAILKRVADKNNNGILNEGIIEIDTLSHVAKVNNVEIELSFKEFELLKYLIKNKKIALSREQILNDVWDYDYFGDARTVDTHIKKLRAKLGDAGDYIKTIRGLGYKFEV
jgi:DNA-binding response OmpR family regulator